jgi:hypothetical protein
VSEPAVGQLWPSVFGHSEWKHLVHFVMADEEDVSVKIRQRCVIEVCVKLGKSGNETFEMLQQAYGGQTFIKTTVKCVETLEFATTQKIPFISLGG